MNVTRLIPCACLGLAATCGFPVTASAQIFNSLEWLPLPETTDWSYHGIRSEFASGGAFEGYRHATLEETWNLAYTFGFNPEASVQGNAEAVQDLQDFLGVTTVSSAFQFNAWTLGFTEDGTRFDIRITIPDFSDPSSYEGRVYTTDYPFLDVATPQIGHYLVRVVPEPAQVALLFGLAALLLILRSHRRR